VYVEANILVEVAFGGGAFFLEFLGGDLCKLRYLEEEIGACVDRIKRRRSYCSQEVF